MQNQLEKIQLFKALHVKGNPLVLCNIWDAGSARAAQEIGSKAIATSSWAVAHSHGYADGEALPLELVLANLKRIVRDVDLPVTIDIESGYGKTPPEVQETASKIIAAGSVGINIEDQIIGGDGLYSYEDQCTRIKAIRELSTPIFINARTDIFFKQPIETHNDQHLEEALFRAHAYAKAGADGIFVPGLQNERLIKTLCELSPIPVNIMLKNPKELSKLGVARISYGPTPYIQALESFKAIADQTIMSAKT
jgi:2-methylisocitrate lyase-like PEP mutase family enzyme